MTGSALVSHPPANDRDLAIIKGMLAGQPQLAGKWPPERGSPPSPLWPPLAERNSDSTGGSVIASSVVVILIVSLVTGTRIAARWTGKHNRIGWDDYFIIAAAIFLIGWTSMQIAEVTNASGGKRAYNHTYEDLEQFRRYAGMTGVFLPVIQGFTKLSIVCFNARLTGITSKTWRWIHRTLFACSLVFLIFWTFFIAFLTHPAGAGFSYIVAGRKGYHMVPGINVFATTLAFTLHHIILDWILLAIPTFIVFRLQMPMIKKLRCIVPLLIGVLSCVGASYCAHLLKVDFTDLSYQAITIISWRQLDLTCAVLATSLPSIAVLVTHHMPESWKKYYSSHRSTPKIYVGDQSNPLSSSKKLTSMVTPNRSSDRDRYDEIGHGINVQHDIDLESLRSEEYVKSRM